MKTLRNLVLTAVLTLVATAGGTSAQGDPECDAYAWLQYAADGKPHVRVIPRERDPDGSEHRHCDLREHSLRSLRCDAVRS